MTPATWKSRPKASPPDGRPAGELDQRLGLPDAATSSTFTASRLDHRDSQLDHTQRHQVITRLQRAAEELGYQSRR